MSTHLEIPGRLLYKHDSHCHGGVSQLLKYLLANGSMEYKSAKEEKGILAGDERELEALLANLLHGKVRLVHPCT